MSKVLDAAVSAASALSAGSRDSKTTQQMTDRVPDPETFLLPANKIATEQYAQGRKDAEEYDTPSVPEFIPDPKNPHHVDIHIHYREGYAARKAELESQKLVK